MSGPTLNIVFKCSLHIWLKTSDVFKKYKKATKLVHDMKKESEFQWTTQQAGNLHHQEAKVT